MDGVKSLFQSRKFVVLLSAIVLIGVLVALGRVTYDQAVIFLTVTVPTFLAAVAGEDMAKAGKK
jgi:hypothetical protein